MNKYCMFYLSKYVSSLDDYDIEKHFEYIFEYKETKDNIIFSGLHFIYEDDSEQILMLSEDKTKWANRFLNRLKPCYLDVIRLPDDTYSKFFVEADTDEDAIKQCLLLKEIGVK